MGNDTKYVVVDPAKEHVLGFYRSLHEAKRRVNLAVDGGYYIYAKVYKSV
jgi:hypothetical protein